MRNREFDDIKLQVTGNGRKFDDFSNIEILNDIVIDIK